MMGPLFMECGDVNAALLHYAWYEKACADDIGEPIHSLFWSLGLYRAGDQIRAREQVLETRIQNTYPLPGLLRLPVVHENIWHSSGLAEPGYFHETPPEFVPAFSREEVVWIGDQLTDLRGILSGSRIDILKEV